MLCQVCGKKEANVHLTQMLNNEVRKLHLCEQCAAKHGIDVEAPSSVSNFLLGLALPDSAKAEKAGRACRQCGMRLAEFKKLSRLGCPACYAAFARELEPLLSGMHKGTRHAGKQPVHHPANFNLPVPLEGLRKSLAAAVAAENYEEAARIRDQIRTAQGGPGPGKESPR